MTPLPDPSTGLAALKAALDLPKPVIDLACGLVNDLIGRPVHVAGGMITDEVYYWRWRNRVRIAHRAAEIMDRDGIARRIVPPSFLLPLLDAAGNVEDPDLQEMWAQLLASGVEADEHQHPMWVRILAQMSAEDARAFEAACAATDCEGIAFVPAGGRPGFGPLPAIRTPDARLVALGLAVMVTHHLVADAAGVTAFIADDQMPVALLDQVGAQFRRAAMPDPAAAPTRG